MITPEQHAKVEKMWREEKQKNKVLVDALEEAYRRMDNARYLLTDGNPTPHRNWGMLDTKLDRQALEGVNQ